MHLQILWENDKKLATNLLKACNIMTVNSKLFRKDKNHGRPLLLSI